MTCLSKGTLKLEDSSSRGFSLYHRGLAPMADWVMSISVVLGSTLSLTTLMYHIGVNK
jgi:hypothetical protein